MLLVVGTTVFAQDVMVRDLDGATTALGWSASVSDVPTIEMSGLWRFVPDRSDPMVEIWSECEVKYEISHQMDRIVMAFRPENGELNVQEYRWNGSVNSFRRGTAEVRERAFWTDRGRTLEIEGR